MIHVLDMIINISYLAIFVIFTSAQEMFFEAVEELMKKIEDPKVKSSVKDDLRKEMKDLDPKGEIQAFLKGKASRPDLSARITESMYVLSHVCPLYFYH